MKHLLFLTIACFCIAILASGITTKTTSNEQMLINRIDSLKKVGFDITDFHSHLKGGLTIEQLLEHSKLTGIKYGVAANCGIGFPIQNDSALSAYYHKMKKFPVYNAMQAEGREWRKLFSPDSVKLFDYVFTDAMTFTDAKNRRMRLWIKEETFVDDPQQFMDYLVKQIVTITTTEPINLYVNATYLPDSLSPHYDELWTEQRMMAVINALKEKHVAMEISARFKIPSAKFIKLAKANGIKFTFGTNNGAADLGYLEYCLQMIKECTLKPSDMWTPAKK